MSSYDTYIRTLHYLYDRLPMFHRVGTKAYKKDLTNIKKLCEVLQNPHLKIPAIHIAGTNGKGSSAHMLASVLQSAGYKTGLYTSPHLVDFTERIRIQGEEIKRDFVIQFVNKIKPFIESIQPSFFEVTVAMAFDYFSYHQVDMAIVETGLGGRLDSTNIIVPCVSLITNVSHDHGDLLGRDLVTIAAEKGGIIKSGVPVVVSERQVDIEHVFIQKARALGSPLFFGSDEYFITRVNNGQFQAKNREKETTWHLDIDGFYQSKNLAGVLTVIDQLSQMGYIFSHRHLQQGFSQIKKHTGLRGRWQFLSHQPSIVCDVAHNSASVKLLIDQVKKEKYNQLHMVWGMSEDKDTDDILSLLPSEAHYYFCEAQISRALPSSVLTALAKNRGLQGMNIPKVKDAMRQAIQGASSDDFILVSGSAFVVGEVIHDFL